ncbi:MAG TPA: response regulator [Candidatus Sulfotelmatobacter sp.]|nr:response regulator [Candidatus Sulfotelmatobacter sp.]
MARKILLADDSVTAQNMGRKILADAGYEVITVNNGSAALKKINEQKPDLIVLDVYMPGYSGLEVCQRLKEVGETSRIPILLTVGKLEPFKPEEVKRVRADGFIVKPFEASELLSALSKLEDRIVPRSESSKPGRFARATAAIDEGRYDKTVAIEEDSGWKNRIAFPSKRKGKEKDAEPEADEPAAYTPVNKDLRAVIEHKLAEAPANGKTEDRVDLGALAPVGLPKDVTPEEIAALAAAAAQMQGKVAESKGAERAPDTVPTPAAVDTTKVDSPQEVHSESQQEASPSAATFAEHKTQEPAEAKLAEATSPSSVPNSGNGSGPHVASTEPATDEPVTMAVGGLTAETAPGSSRWTAVSVALAPEDAAISLEQEMQKAYAAFAAAESGHAGSVSSFRESDPAVTNQNSTAVENVSPDPVVQVPASAAPEVAQTLTAVANAATDAMSAAAEKLEAVADSYVEPKEPAASVEPAAATRIEAAAQLNAPVTAQSEAVEAEKADVQAAPQSAPENSGNEESREDASHAEIPSMGLGGIPVGSASISASTTEQASERTAESAEPPTGKESDIAATTAAAWATWRSNRESGHPDSAAESTNPQEIAAKAVAAGAEGSSAEVSADAASDPAIASIVDSMLADLRPKIFEEISRKLGKKK